MDRKKTICLMLPFLSFFFGLEGNSADKSQYNLFHPTPREEMRPFTIDPGPNTVDAGHIAVETELVTFKRQKNENPGGEPVITNTLSYGQMNFRVGLFSDVEVQLGTPPYISHFVRTGAEESRLFGFGDIIFRVKMNMFGNDDGPVALAIMPILKFPTAKRSIGNHYVEPGLSAPLGMELPGDFSLSIVSQLHLRRDERGGSYREFGSVTNLEYQISKKAAIYGEFSSDHSSAADAPWAASVGGGATYLLSSDLMVDAGLNFGATPAAPEINPFISLSFRF